MLERFHEHREGDIERLVDEEMDVFGHQNVGVDSRVVASAGALQNFFDGGFGDGVGEVWAATVTTEGDEVVITRLLVSFEAEWHGSSYRVGTDYDLGAPFIAVPSR